MTVRVAGGQGFYGDTPRAVEGLLADGVDYLCLEALAELTLAILQKDRQKDETRGFTRDLPVYLAAALPEVAAGRTRVITNAGGINPTAAARAAVADGPRPRDLAGIRIATVLGDDLTGRARRSRAADRARGTSTPARRSPSCPPLRCSRRRTSVRARSSTRSRRVPTW